MDNSQAIDIDYAVSYCESISAKHKNLAADFSNSGAKGNAEKYQEHISKAQMADEIAAHFSGLENRKDRASPEVEERAKKITPEPFASRKAMIKRLKDQGRNDEYAIEMADATYGRDIDQAFDDAAESLRLEQEAEKSLLPYLSGLEDAIQWHLHKANQAEAKGNNSRNPKHRQKYSSRAERHRLFAKYIKIDLVDAKNKQYELEREHDNAQQSLSLKPPMGGARAQNEKGVPIEVQIAFMKKSEVMDDEGW